MTKVLVIAPTSFFSNYGSSVRILEECRALLDLGYDVSIYTYKKGRSPAGLSIHRIPFTPKNLKPGPSYHRIYLDGLLLSSTLAHSLAHAPDVIHAHLHEGVVCSALQSWLLGCPLVVDLQDSIVDELVRHKFLKCSGISYSVASCLEKLLVKCADFIICSSVPVYDIVANKFGVRKCALLHDCVDTETFRPKPKNWALIRGLRIPDCRKIVVYLGTLSHIQGTDILLQAIRILLNKHTGVHFILMGFPNVEKYRLLAKSLRISDHVSFIGEVDYFTEAPSFLSVADIAVAPKLYTSESNGKVLLYMSMGLPTVVFDNPTNRFLLGDLGIYAKETSPASLAEAILQALLNAPDEHLSVALRNRALTLFSKEAFRSRLLHIYEALLAET